MTTVTTAVERVIKDAAWAIVARISENDYPLLDHDIEAICSVLGKEMRKIFDKPARP